MSRNNPPSDEPNEVDRVIAALTGDEPEPFDPTQPYTFAPRAVLQVAQTKGISSRVVKVLFYIACSLLLITVLGSLTVAALALHTSTTTNENATRQSKINEDRIAQVQAQLSDTAAALTQFQAEDTARTACDLLFADDASNRFAAYLFGIGDLVQTIAIPPGTEGRADQVKVKLDALTQLKVARDDLAKQRRIYLDAGRPLPCPAPKE